MEAITHYLFMLLLEKIGMKRIGLLGCGSIGSKIAIAIDTGKIPAKFYFKILGKKAKKKIGSIGKSIPGGKIFLRIA